MIVTTGNIAEITGLLAQNRTKTADTETFGLLVQDLLFSVIITSGSQSYYFNFKDYPEEGIVGLNIKDPFILSCMITIFGNPDDTWEFHNIKFDLHKLENAGITVAGTLWCTKTHQRILKNNLMSYELGDLTRHQINKKSGAVDEFIAEKKLFTVIDIKGKQRKEKLLHFDKVPFRIIHPYGIGDTMAAGELAATQRLQYSEDRSLHRVRDNELKLVRPIYEMERTGIKIDPAFVLKAWEHEAQLIRESEESFMTLTGVEFKDTKKLGLVKILSAAGENIQYSQETGNPVLDKAALKLMKSPVAKIVQKMRFYEKRISSFYSTFIYYRDHDNIIRPNIDPAGTESGRFSMSRPNLQQLSKDKDHADNQQDYAIRKCFVPRAEKCFVQLDYSQVEYKIMLDYANEKQMLRMVGNGYDIHTATAELVGVTRDEAKTLNFRILYGSGPQGVADSLGISLSDGQKLIYKYFSALPMVEDLIARVRGAGKNKGSVFNWLGRRCSIADRSWNYILPNHLIQSSGADVMKVAIVRVWEFLKAQNAESKMVLTVHDSVVLEMPASEFCLLPAIKNILETAYEPRNNVVLSTTIEHSWVSLSAADLVKGMPA